MAMAGFILSWLRDDEVEFSKVEEKRSTDSLPRATCLFPLV